MRDDAGLAFGVEEGRLCSAASRTGSVGILTTNPPLYPRTGITCKNAKIIASRS